MALHLKYCATGTLQKFNCSTSEDLGKTFQKLCHSIPKFKIPWERESFTELSIRVENGMKCMEAEKKKEYQNSAPSGKEDVILQKEKTGKWGEKMVET